MATGPSLSEAPLARMAAVVVILFDFLCLDLVGVDGVELTGEVEVPSVSEPSRPEALKVLVVVGGVVVSAVSVVSVREDVVSFKASCEGTVITGGFAPKMASSSRSVCGIEASVVVETVAVTVARGVEVGTGEDASLSSAMESIPGLVVTAVTVVAGCDGSTASTVPMSAKLPLLEEPSGISEVRDLFSGDRVPSSPKEVLRGTFCDGVGLDLGVPPLAAAAALPRMYSSRLAFLCSADCSRFLASTNICACSRFHFSESCRT